MSNDTYDELDWWDEPVESRSRFANFVDRVRDAIGELRGRQTATVELFRAQQNLETGVVELMAKVSQTEGFELTWDGESPGFVFTGMPVGFRNRVRRACRMMRGKTQPTFTISKTVEAKLPGMTAVPTFKGGDAQ